MSNTPRSFPLGSYFDAVFARHGWVRRPDAVIYGFRKQFETAVGVREAEASIRPIVDHAAGKVRLYVLGSYDSEGLNVMDSLFTSIALEDESKFGPVVDDFLCKAEQRIRGTYAVQLLEKRDAILAA